MDMSKVTITPHFDTQDKIIFHFNDFLIILFCRQISTDIDDYNSTRFNSYLRWTNQFL